MKKRILDSIPIWWWDLQLQELRKELKRGPLPELKSFAPSLLYQILLSLQVLSFHEGMNRVSGIRWSSSAWSRISGWLPIRSSLALTFQKVYGFLVFLRIACLKLKEDLAFCSEKTFWKPTLLIADSGSTISLFSRLRTVLSRRLIWIVLRTCDASGRVQIAFLLEKRGRSWIEPDKWTKIVPLLSFQVYLFQV